MGLSQPKVTPLPPNINLNGKTAVITGATSGLGLETARQLLRLGVTTLVLAVRNVQKGKACATDLLNDKAIQARTTRPDIHVLKVDMESYESVRAFCKLLKETVSAVDMLILNAGICIFDFARTQHGHERTMQVNYWSNVLLVTEILPYLESSAEKSGSPTRITWVGSRTYYTANSLEGARIPKSTGGVTEYMDSKETFQSLKRYADSKMLCSMFTYALAPRLDKDKVTITLVCPGMVKTNLTADASLPIRLVSGVLAAIRARSVDMGGLLIVNAAVVAGAESHGQLLGDKDIVEPTDYMKSGAGQKLQNQLWAETVKEMGTLTALPRAFV